jgi:hypothetical protein
MRHHRDGSIERCLCSRDLQSFSYFGENCCTLALRSPKRAPGAREAVSGPIGAVFDHEDLGAPNLVQ